MNVNLRRSYGLEHSPSRSKEAFIFSQKSNFLFEEAGDAVVKCQTALRAYRLEWQLCHNCVEAPILSGECRLDIDNLFAIPVPVEALAPGFYDLRVKVQHTAKTFTSPRVIIQQVPHATRATVGIGFDRSSVGQG